MMQMLLFMFLLLVVPSALFIPRRLFKQYVRVMAALWALLLFWALTLEKNADGAHIYGLFLVMTFIVITLFFIGIRYIMLRKAASTVAK